LSFTFTIHRSPFTQFGVVHRRIALFAAASLLLHAVTIFGVGPLRLTGWNPATQPARFELRVTLAPARSPAIEVNPLGAEPSERPAPTDGEAGGAAGDPASGASAQSPRDPHAAEALAGLALPFPDRWYTAREVDVRAEPVTTVPLRYPESLKGSLAAGRVHLRLFIDEHGVVRRMQVTASDPPGLFDEAAKRAWEQVRFTPALRSGVPVKSQKLIEVLYRAE
jgi:protein TonB